jgi:hypothetical protein
MSTVNYVWNNRVSKPKLPGPGTYLFGFYSDRNTTGTNLTAADRLAGVRPEHPYSGTRSFLFSGTMSWWQRDFGVITLYEDASPTIGASNVRAWDSNDEIALLAKLADKYRVSNWNAGIFVGELGKTVDSIASRAKQLAKAAVAVKKLQISKALSILKAKPSNDLLKFRTSTKFGKDTISATELWLELRYAWRPLLKDIFDLSDAIRNKDVPRVRRIHVQRFIGKNVFCSSPTVFSVSGTGRYLKSIVAIVEEKPFSYPQYLGLTNPESVVWELVPFSFVADWFIPIGTYLEARNVISSITKGTYVRTTFDWYKGKVTGTILPYSYIYGSGAHTYGYSSVGMSFNSYVQISRTIVTSLTVPLPTFKNPIGNNPATRALDAITLFMQVVRSMK